MSTNYEDLLLFRIEEIRFANIINFIRQFSLIIIFFVCFYKVVDLIVKKTRFKKKYNFYFKIFLFFKSNSWTS